MAVTPNYSWPIPVATDYVKDGWDAIADLGNAIDSTVFGLGTSGCVLVKTQTIGTAVSSVTVTGAFNTTYDNYKIIINGAVSSATTNIGFQLGSTTTGYYAGGTDVNYGTAGVAGLNNNNSALFSFAGYSTVDNLALSAEVQNPFLSKLTTFSTARTPNTTGAGSGFYGGYQNSTTSFTSFVIIPGSGTITGGTIYVYGYKKS